MEEVIFLVGKYAEDSYLATALHVAIVTEAHSLEELKEAVKGAVHCHFDNELQRPKMIRLQGIEDVLLSA